MQTDLVPVETKISPKNAKSAQPTLNGEARGEVLLNLPIMPQRWSTIVTIPPDIARMILCGMPDQRPRYPDTVDYFMNVMRRGEFLTTHQGIAFSQFGKLIDGQHRLEAACQLDMPITVQVNFNVPDEQFQAFDRGKNRTLANDLQQLGITKTSAAATTLQASARLLFHWDAGRLPWLSTPKILSSDVVAVIHRHRFLNDMVAESGCIRNVGLSVPQAAVCAFGAIFMEVDQAKAAEFLQQFKTGEGLLKSSPVMALRHSLDRGNQRRKVARNAFMVKFVRAWNAFYEDREMVVLRSAMLTGEFPKVSGYRAG